MFTIESKRLRLIPLSYDQLSTLAINRNQLEISLSLSPSQFELSSGESFMEEFTSSIVKYTMVWVKKKPESWMWFTHWLIVHRESNLCVGGIGGTGLPDANREIMLGYFIDVKSEGCGFATEALGAFSQWLFTHPGLDSIVTDTLSENIASQKVLLKNGFIASGTSEEGPRWKLFRP